MIRDISKAATQNCFGWKLGTWSTWFYGKGLSNFSNKLSPQTQEKLTLNQLMFTP